MKFSNLLLLLLIEKVAKIMAHHSISIINFDVLPQCARSCNILGISEHNCLPPLAPVTDNVTYNNCFCQSDYLRSLHSNGEICHEVCSDNDDSVIYHYYNALCGTPHPDPAVTTSLPATPTSTSMPLDTPSESPGATPPSSSHDNATSVSTDHHKALIIALCVALPIIFLLGVLAWIFCRRRKNAQVAKQNEENGLIPLQLVDALISQSTRPPSQDTRPRTARSSANLNDVPIPAARSPLELSGSDQSLAASLRFYVEEIREQEAAWEAAREAARQGKRLRATRKRPEVPGSKPDKPEKAKASRSSEAQ